MSMTRWANAKTSNDGLALSGHCVWSGRWANFPSFIRGMPPRYPVSSSIRPLSTLGELEAQNGEISKPWGKLMKVRILRLCTFTLISLLSLFGLAAQAGAQGYTLNQLGGSPELQAKTRRTHKAKIPDASGYSVLY